SYPAFAFRMLFPDRRNTLDFPKFQQFADGLAEVAWRLAPGILQVKAPKPIVVVVEPSKDTLDKAQKLAEMIDVKVDPANSDYKDLVDYVHKNLLTGTKDQNDIKTSFDSEVVTKILNAHNAKDRKSSGN